MKLYESCMYFCMVSLSLFADPEQILRRFSVFAEEPRKSTITALNRAVQYLRRLSQDPPTRTRK